MSDAQGRDSSKWTEYDRTPQGPPIVPNIRWTRATKLKRSTETVVLFDSTASDCIGPNAIPLSSGNNAYVSFYGDEAYVGLRHKQKTSANVLFADGHVEGIKQPILVHTVSDARRFGPHNVRSWYFEFTGSDKAARKASTTRNPEQTLIWDYTRVTR